jgi:hypothetical protein
VTKTELYTLDPQQRLVMENTYHALENAGISMKDVTGSKTSVYTTGFNVDHAALLNTDPETTLKYRPQGTTNSIIAGRVSWFYDLKGPCMTIDTACSSSMVALHLACTSLQLGESDMVSLEFLMNIQMLTISASPLLPVLTIWPIPWILWEWPTTAFYLQTESATASITERMATLVEKVLAALL